MDPDSRSTQAAPPSAEELQTVVRNSRGQYSLWPTDRQVPVGWRPVGEPASREHCLASVEALWTDLRPTGRGAPAATLPRLLAERAAEAGGRPAVLWAHGSLSYAQLEVRAARLARRLRGFGVGAESVVTVCLERSPGMVVGLLAVLKAGAGFLPVDPALPERRLTQLLDDSPSTLVLTSADHARFAAGHAEVVLLEENGRQAAPGPGAALPVGPDPDDLAYMIYTSGSTGLPKGVMVDHRSFARVLLNLVDAYGLGQLDRVLQLAALGFDTSLEQIFATLLGGATLVLPTGPGWAPTDLPHRLREYGVTIADLTPSYWHQFLGAAGRAAPPLPSCAWWWWAVTPCRPTTAAAGCAGCPGCSWSTPTGSPRRPSPPCSATWTRTSWRPRRPVRCRSAARSRTPRSNCWTPSSGRSRWATRARSSSAAAGWPADSGASPGGRPRASCPTRTPPSPAGGCTARATAGVGGRTGGWSSWGGSTTR